MSRISIPTVESAPSGMPRTFRRTVLGQLEGYLSLSGALGKGALDAGVR